MKIAKLYRSKLSFLKENLSFFCVVLLFLVVVHTEFTNQTCSLKNVKLLTPSVVAQWIIISWHPLPFPQGFDNNSPYSLSRFEQLLT